VTPLPANAAQITRGVEVLALQSGDDAADHTDTDLRIFRKLDGDIAQELIAITRRDRTSGFHHGVVSQFIVA
jgi:hypothetical protein